MADEALRSRVALFHHFAGRIDPHWRLLWASTLRLGAAGPKVKSVPLGSPIAIASICGRQVVDSIVSPVTGSVPRWPSISQQARDEPHEPGPREWRRSGSPVSGLGWAIS